MNPPDVQNRLEEFNDTLPHFDDGRINYKDAKTSLTITAFAYFEGKILLLKRSEKVTAYSGLWDGIAGFVDRMEPVENKVFEELEEETGIGRSQIDQVMLGDLLNVEDKEIGRTWLIVPALVVLKTKPDIKLDWEHTDYNWVDPKDISAFKTPPGAEDAMASALSLVHQG